MPKLPLPLLFLLLTSLPFSVISQPLSAGDRSTLSSLRQQWGNPLPLHAWDPSTSTCRWPGITCSTTGAVTGISLRNLNLTGEIPLSICKLKSLTTLDLGWNFISGEFPRFLYNCSNLQYLDLSQNLLVGLIPKDIYKLSPRIQYLDLSSNNFTGEIPSSIGQLKGLKSLFLHQNLFNVTIPNELGNLVSLETLILAFNPFSPTKIPQEFGFLKRLKYLRLAECNLMGEIPESLGNLSGLEHLDLEGNDLVGKIPSGLFLLKNLTHLYLYKNRLSGSIPGSIEALNLVEIDLAMNNLTGVLPEDLGKLKNLEVLNLFDNEFSGEVPESIGLLPKLRELRLFSNKLSGVLPPDLGLHSRLEAFEVADNGFSGQLPKNLCAGGTLFGVVAFSNGLSGVIPESLGNCSTIMIIRLHNNSFSGEVPPGVWTLFNLTQLMLSDNSFSGQIPSKLARNLTRLEITNNRFLGSIPSGTRDWRNLVIFKASNNMLSGTVPLELTLLSELIILLLDGNQLSGEIPSKIISWQSLNTLNLARNNLFGAIPSKLGSLPDLIDLDLSNNHLTGEIPIELGRLKLTSLNLSSNKLTGQIPYQFDNMAYENSFLNNSNLCSDIRISSLATCSSLTHKAKNLPSRNLALILVLALIAFLVCLYFTVLALKEYRHRKHRQELATWKLTSFHRLDFTEENILSNLTDNNLIGSGGSGKVYRIPVNRAGDSVAVKRIWNKMKMGHLLDKEFIAEVQILGRIRHFNIVKLLCCISSEDSRLLVYEYMPNQSLDQWLRTKNTSLSSGILAGGLGSVHSVGGLDWPTRVRIAVGAAQGLSYMHHDCSPPIIHRDVKSSNILLDSEFNAKIADFGLAKLSVKGGEPYTVSAVAGSFGYMAPEYCYTTKVNEKIDVYSFGVVLLELTTGKEPQNGAEHLNLAEWAWRHYSEGRPIVDVLDEEVKEPCYLDEMTNVFTIGLMCTSTLASSRPSMKEVLELLQRCSLLEGSGRTKTENEFDVTPLLRSDGRASSRKNSRRVAEEDEYSLV